MILQVGQCMLLCCCCLFCFRYLHSHVCGMVQSCSAHSGSSNVEKTVLGSIKCCTVVFALGWVSQFVFFLSFDKLRWPQQSIWGVLSPQQAYKPCTNLCKPGTLNCFTMIFWEKILQFRARKKSLWGARRKGAVPGVRHRTFRIFRT